ncbi:MAG: hypothetical protein HETSPECPRED_002599 [Heterodermia speciosa]|uniref:Uncharacterized protein n=1 Tax=Heterodermia speciosa TaxID=116794 RepID=A0A8H3IJE4_9LECA|nr:MAG: hypothetical protein HETSPECPRED_002599 [Heterodermia speciosa]
MASTSSSYYTLRFTCTLSITIPCSSTSPDHGKTYPIDKPCPQCAPHPHLIPVIFDQAHWDEMQALKAARKRTDSVGTQRDALSLTSASDQSETRSVLSSDSRCSARSRIAEGFERLRGLVRREEGKRGRGGRDGSVTGRFARNGLTAKGDGEEGVRARVKGEEGRKGKEREIKAKLDEVEREVVVEKVTGFEQALRVLA